MKSIVFAVALLAATTGVANAQKKPDPLPLPGPGLKTPFIDEECRVRVVQECIRDAGTSKCTHKMPTEGGSEGLRASIDTTCLFLYKNCDHPFNANVVKDCYRK